MVHGNEVDYPYFPFRLKIDLVLVSRIDNLSRQVYRTAFEKIVDPFLFTLVSTPFWRLCREAERSFLYAALKNVSVEPSPQSSFPMASVFVVTDSVSSLSVPFQRVHGPLYLHFEDERKFFSSAQRSMLTHQILCDIDINKFIDDGSEEKEKRKGALLLEESPESLKKKGLMFMLMEEDSFILHDPSEEEPYYKKLKSNSILDFRQFLSEMEDDPRRRLSSLWSSWTEWQPLNLIRAYFGEQIAFYFAWQGTFCTLLWPAATVGVGVFAFGLCKSISSAPDFFSDCFIVNSTGYTQEVACSTRSHIAQFFSALSRWALQSFDTELTAFYAVFMSIWGTLFFQIWIRNSAVLTCEWDCEQLAETEPDRAPFVGTTMETDQVTGEVQLMYPSSLRFLKLLLSFLVVVLSMAAVVFSVIAVTLYKCFAMAQLECGKEFNLACSLATALVPSLLNTISTMILGAAYSSLVVWLTDWENHRMESEYNKALIVKLFSFQFVNNYTSLFYIAFVRPESHGLQPNGLFGLGPAYKDVCKEGTCGSLLALQLIIHLLIKPVPKFTKDVIIPYFVRLAKLARWMRREEMQTLEEVIAEREEKNVLIREWMKPDAGEFALGEFSEKMLLFGTTMMFAALFPLAPLIALVIGLADLRIDASRLVWFNRRPVPVRVAGIGIWLKILTFIQYAAVLTNAFIVAFTSDFCTLFFSGSLTCSVQNRLLIVLVMQNATFALKYVVESVIPSAPAQLRVSQRRKRYVARYVAEQGNAPERVFKKKSKLVSVAGLLGKKRKASSPSSTTSTSKTRLITMKKKRTKVKVIQLGNTSQ